MPSVSESKDGLTDSYRPLLTVFWITTAIFLFLIAFMFTQDWIPNAEKFSTFVFLPGISVLCILGIALMVLAARAKIMKGLKNAFLIVGTSSIGMPVSIVLHNVLYAAIRAGFGNDILQKLGGNGDEAFFFILGVMVFPAIFIVSLAYCAYVCTRAKGDISA